MDSGNTISGDPYDVQIDHLNHLIYAQEMIVRLKQEELISNTRFLEKWIYYEYRIKDMFDFLRRQGFVVLFETESQHPLYMRAKRRTNLRMPNH